MSVCVRIRGQEFFFLCNTRFEIRPFALLPTVYKVNEQQILIVNIFIQRIILFGRQILKLVLTADVLMFLFFEMLL